MTIFHQLSVKVSSKELCGKITTVITELKSNMHAQILLILLLIIRIIIVEISMYNCIVMRVRASHKVCHETLIT